MDTMPPQIQRSVNEENLQFMCNRDVYCSEYFDFVFNLTSANRVCCCLLGDRGKGGREGGRERGMEGGREV